MSELRPIKSLVKVLGETLLEIAERMEAEEKASECLNDAVEKMRAAILKGTESGASPICQAFRDID